MKYLDRLLQSWRAKQAAFWVPDGARVLDIGCHQGEFLDGLRSRISNGVGMDPLATPRQDGKIELKRDAFQDRLPFMDASFDAIVMLATLEHMHGKEQLVAECRRVLHDKGRVIITLPAPAVDYLLAALHAMRLIDGMSLEEHHGFQPQDAVQIFQDVGFTLGCRRRFQLGLNNLYVFDRAGVGDQ